MTVYETTIPSVGHKFELELADGVRIVVLIHHDGQREVYRRASAEADSTKLFELSGEEGRQLGAILGGVFFQPVETDDLEIPLGEKILEWVEVSESSPIVGETIASSDLETDSDVSIIAIQRDGETMERPAASERIEVGDILIGVGSRESHADFKAAVMGHSDDG